MLLLQTPITALTTITLAYASRMVTATRLLLAITARLPVPNTDIGMLCCRECGFTVVEVNASDTRSKSDNKASTGIGGKLANIVREMVTSNALSAASGAKRQQVLIMDECDGMSGGVLGPNAYCTDTQVH